MFMRSSESLLREPKWLLTHSVAALSPTCPYQTVIFIEPPGLVGSTSYVSAEILETKHYSYTAEGRQKSKRHVNVLEVLSK